MSGEELSRKDQRFLDGIALTADAHDAGMIEAYEEILRRATQPGATMPDLVQDLKQRLAEFSVRRPEAG
jgi:hypothetical protein